MGKSLKYLHAKETKNTKACTKCLEILPINSFTKERQGRRGLRYWCKSCEAAYRVKKLPNPKRFTRAELEKRKELRKLETKNTKLCTKCLEIKKLPEFLSNKVSGRKGVQGVCKKCRKEYLKKHRQGSDLIYKYNMTLEDYDELLFSQNGVCAICGVDNPGSLSRFSVDHNHKTGKIRGLLCMSCNIALGHMKDDPARLEAAAHYLRGFKDG